MDSSFVLFPLQEIQRILHQEMGDSDLPTPGTCRGIDTILAKMSVCAMFDFVDMSTFKMKNELQAELARLRQVPEVSRWLDPGPSGLTYSFFI